MTIELLLALGKSFLFVFAALLPIRTRRPRHRFSSA